jgi:tRNA threonylcarbamoyladenosine biosynthesis protein TsaB
METKMKILAIESSAVTASVAILTDETVTAEYTINYKKTHSQTLLPMIDQICQMTETDVDTLDLIGVSVGPGSFTGLRIGVATAKGIALAKKIPVAPVPTLEAMAYNFAGTEAAVCTVMDARRDHVYGAVYHFEDGKLVCDVEQGLYENLKMAELLNDFGKNVVIMGDGVGVMDKVRTAITCEFQYAAPNMNTQRAASVALLAKQMYNEGRAVAGSAVVPDYIRPSQAERELEANHAQYKTYD